MSLVKAANVQLGTGPSASNNFNWRNLLDGLLRLSRGDAGAPITDVMRVKADNSVEFPGGVVGMFGVGQVPLDVTASRSKGTVYTNSTGNTRYVKVVLSQVSTVATTLSVNGVVVDSINASTSGEQSSLSYPVPNGQTYQVAGGSSTVALWTELG